MLAEASQHFFGKSICDSLSCFCSRNSHFICRTELLARVSDPSLRQLSHGFDVLWPGYWVPWRALEKDSLSCLTPACESEERRAGQSVSVASVSAETGCSAPSNGGWRRCYECIMVFMSEARLGGRLSADHVLQIALCCCNDSFKATRNSGCF